MAIYWMKTRDVYPDSGWREDNAFMAFDPDVRFPRFNPVEGDEPIGNVRLVDGGLAVLMHGKVDEGWRV